MRQLTARQKKLLNSYNHVMYVEELPEEVWLRLIDLNDTEILYQEVQRYLFDNYKEA